MLKFGVYLKSAILVTALIMSGISQAANVAYENVGFIRGYGEQSQSFTVATEGTYSAMLTDFSFPANFDVLGMSVTTSMTELGRISTEGSFTFFAKPEMVLYANVFGEAGGALDLGLYGINISVISDVVAPVPVPGSLLLMLSAMVVIGAIGRDGKKEKETIVKGKLLAV
jgi:hypothetical protein